MAGGRRLWTGTFLTAALAMAACGDDGTPPGDGSGGAGASTTSSDGATTTSTSADAGSSTSTSGTASTGASGSGGDGGAGEGGTGHGGAGGAGEGGAGGGGAGGAGEGGAGGGAGGGGGAAPVCDLEGVEVTTEDGAITSDQGVLLYNGKSVDESDVVVVELWFQYGAQSEPHTFTFTGENNADCHTCAVLLTDCVDGDCARRFLIESGTLVVTALDLEAGTYAATLTDVVAVESTIDPVTYVSAPVPGGETWCVDGPLETQMADFFELGFTLTKP